MIKITPHKKFIAGAICPQCAAQDTLYVAHHKRKGEYQACIECDHRVYKESQPQIIAKSG